VFAFCTTVVTVLVDIITSCIGFRFWKDCCIHGSNFESDMRQGKGDNVSEFGKMQFVTFLKRIKTVMFLLDASKCCHCEFLTCRWT